MEPAMKTDSRYNTPFLRLMFWILFLPSFLFMQKNLSTTVYLLTCFVFIYALLLFTVPKINNLLDSILPVTLVIDMTFLSLTVALSEKYFSALATIYILPIIVSGFKGNPYWPYYTASFCTLAYLAVSFYKGFPLFPVIIQIIVFFITAFYTDFLTQHLHQSYFKQVNQDTLTKISNRRFLNHSLDKLVQRQTPFCLMLIDLDNFKKLNDTQGHHHGDYVLKVIGSILKEYTRPYDIVARFGGDEFAILLPNTNKEASKAIAERIRHSVLVHPKLLPYSFISLSIGIAAFPDDAPTIEQLLEKTDKALYTAKDRGKNYIHLC